MSELQKLKKEIQSTLDQEKSNIFDGHQDEDSLRGWIEALEYCVREIELLEGNKSLFTNDPEQINQLALKFNNKYISEEK